jgi:hypothetical protein
MARVSSSLVSDLRAAREGRQEAGGKFKRVMKGQDGEHAVPRRHVEDGGQHRDHAGEILVRQHDAFGLARRARSEDERGGRLRVDFRGQEGDALVLDLLRRQREDFLETPEARRFQLLLLQALAQVIVLLAQFVADDDAEGFARADEVDDLGRRTFRVYGHAGRSRLEHAEIGHAPFGRVVADEDDAIRGTQPFAGEEPGGARGEFVHVPVGVLLFAAVALDAHGDARRVAFGRGLEKFEQVAVGVDALRLRAHVLFKLREDPFLEAGKMDVHPIVVPVELFRVPRQQILFVLPDAREQRAHVVGAEDVGVLDHERAKHLERFLRLVRQLFEPLDVLFGVIDKLGDAAAAPARAHAIQQ